MVLFFVSLTLSHAPACAVRPQIYGSGLRDVPVYSLAFIPHPPWPLLISDVGLELEGTLINCSLL